MKKAFQSFLRDADWRISDRNNLFLIAANGDRLRITLPNVAIRLRRLLTTSAENLSEQERMELAVLRAAAIKAQKIASVLPEEEEVEIRRLRHSSRTGFYFNAEVLHAQSISEQTQPVSQSVVIATTPDKIPLLRESLELSGHTVVSVLIVGKDSFLIGPIVPWTKWCEMCMSYSAAVSFNCFERPDSYGDVVSAALAIAKLVKPSPQEVLRFENLQLHRFLHSPVVGCSTCT